MPQPETGQDRTEGHIPAADPVTAPAPTGPIAPVAHQAVAAARRVGLLVTLVLGGLTALPPLSMDMYLPALPAVTDSLTAPAATVQLTLTACIAGMAFGQLVVGPMSDRWGRRRPLLIGMVVYVVATAICAVAPPSSCSSASGCSRASRAPRASSSPAPWSAICTTASRWPGSSPP